jgi:uroporphyrin-III C-methyltransferase
MIETQEPGARVTADAVSEAVATPPTSHLLIAAHGSSFDAEARDRVHRHAARIAELVPHTHVHVAFARGTPSLPDILATVTATVTATATREARAHAASDEGTPLRLTTLTVVPFMTSTGYYAADVLPRLVRDHIDRRLVRVSITRPVGSHRRLTRVLHRRALRLAAQAGWSAHDTTVLLVGHGTRRHAASRDTALRHARALATHGWHAVHAAFIDDDPGVAEVWPLFAPDARVIVLPFLIGGASHATIDVPQALGVTLETADHAQRVRIDGRAVILDAPIGNDPALAELAADLAIGAWTRSIKRRSTSTTSRTGLRTGHVSLVGAGPGAPDLLTVRALRRLRRADVVLHDRLVDTRILAEARIGAALIDVGKRPDTPQTVQQDINAQLVQAAARGQRVVRLKGGDPMVFGRGSEEWDACRAAGIPVEIVSGISSALAAPASVGIPVTARGISRSFAVVTAATATDVDGESSQLAAVAQADTIVVLMGQARVHRVADVLQDHGRAPDTPVACIENATRPEQRLVRGTLSTMAELVAHTGIASPMVIVIGETARMGVADHQTAGSS